MIIGVTIEFGWFTSYRWARPASSSKSLVLNISEPWLDVGRPFWQHSNIPPFINSSVYAEITAGTIWQLGSSIASWGVKETEWEDGPSFICVYFWVYMLLHERFLSTTLSDGRRLLKMQIVALRHLHNKIWFILSFVKFVEPKAKRHERTNNYQQSFQEKIPCSRHRIICLIGTFFVVDGQWSMHSITMNFTLRYFAVTHFFSHEIKII